MPTTTTTRGAILTVRRPNGTLEEVVHTQHADWNGVISAKAFNGMVLATRAAGRGEILSQRPNVVALTLAEQRVNLAAAASCGAGAFPGTRAWTEARKAEAELAAFDAAHPEIVEAQRAERAAHVAGMVASALNA